MQTMNRPDKNSAKLKSHGIIGWTANILNSFERERELSLFGKKN